MSKLPVVSTVTPPLAATSKRNQSSSSPGSISPAVSLGSSTRVAEARSSPWSSVWAAAPTATAAAMSASAQWRMVRQFCRVASATWNAFMGLQ